MVERGPHSRPQASEGEAQHGPFCRTRRTSGPHDSSLRCRPPKYTGLLLRRELRRRVLEHDIDLHRFGRDQEAVVSPLLANSGFDRRLTQRPFLDVVRMSATGDIP